MWTKNARTAPRRCSYGRNEEHGLRCVYHGIKFDVDGNCVDLPCVPQMSDAHRANAQKQLAVKSYPCIERGDVVWTYMGPVEHKPEFPELEWTLLPAAQRYATRHIQECNWLQALEGGFDATHLSFLHGGEGDPSRRIVASLYEVIPTDFGFVVGTGRERGDGIVMWNMNVMLSPFHKIISSIPHAAHVWAPIDDENTMLYSVDFHPSRPLTEEDLARIEGRARHPHRKHSRHRSCHAQPWQRLSDRSRTAGERQVLYRHEGVRHAGLRHPGIDGADRRPRQPSICSPRDAAIVKIRRLLLQTLKDHAAGKPLPGMNPASYRVRSGRFEARKDVPFIDAMEQFIGRDTPIAAE